MTINRRQFVRGAMVAGTALAVGGCAAQLSKLPKLPKVTPPEMSPSGRLVAALRMIEAEADGTLGVAIYDLATRNAAGLNEDRRFGHCSSFKLSLAAKVLTEDARGLIDADRRVTWTKDDLMFVSPFTTQRLAEGATLRELAEFTQKYSDNTAANVLLRELGGPPALTGFWRSIGDDTSRLDRTEPALNNVPVTEFRDTTTPATMARTVATLLYGDVMPEAERATLRQWMIDTPTGAPRVRAGLPEGWVAGDKTGTSIWPGMSSLYVDIGFVEPSRGNDEEPRAPITFAAYFRTRDTHEDMDPAAEAALARVGEVIATLGEKQDWFPL